MNISYQDIILEMDRFSISFNIFLVQGDLSCPGCYKQLFSVPTEI